MHLLEESSTCGRLFQICRAASSPDLFAGQVWSLLVPPACLWGEKSNKCKQFVCAFFHNIKRLIKKHTAGERNAGSSPELVAGQVPTWAAVSVWVVGGVPSCAQLCPMCPALPCFSSSSVRSWHIRLAPIVTHGDQAFSWQKLKNACHTKLERWLSWVTEPKKDSFFSNWRNSRAAAESRLRCVCDKAPCNSNLEKGGTAALADYIAAALLLKEMYGNVYTHE